jgi:hypothetical protein
VAAVRVSCLKILLFGLAERVLRWLEGWAQAAAMAVSLCPDCGGNRYTAPPCVVHYPPPCECLGDCDCHQREPRAP